MSLEQAAEKAKAKMQGSNPSVTPEKPVGERTRIPLSVPERKLEVPEIPGYRLRWFRGSPQRLAQAQRAFYEFVTPDEVQLNNVVIGGDAKKDGNSDLGSRVSVIEGSETDGAGQAMRLYLMKQKEEYWKEDQALIQGRNDSIAEALTASYATGQVGGRAEGETMEDASRRYVDPKRSRMPELFRKKVPGTPKR